MEIIKITEVKLETGTWDVMGSKSHGFVGLMKEKQMVTSALISPAMKELILDAVVRASIIS